MLFKCPIYRHFFYESLTVHESVRTLSHCSSYGDARFKGARLEEISLYLLVFGNCIFFA